MDVDIPTGFVDQFRRRSIQRIERAAMVATDKASRGALVQQRMEMRSRGLGILGNALGQTSDLKKGKVRRRGPEEFETSGVIFLRSKSERTVGAIKSYTEGADIHPVKGRWLWVPTDEIQRLVGSGKTRRRLTPALWSQYGLDTKVGPLVYLPQKGKPPLLIVRNVGVSISGKRHSAKSLTRSGRPRKGQAVKSFIVAFIAIPRTTRIRRVDLIAIANRWAGIVPDLFNEEMRKG